MLKLIGETVSLDVSRPLFKISSHLIPFGPSLPNYPIYIAIKYNEREIIKVNLYCFCEQGLGFIAIKGQIKKHLRI